MVPAVVARRGFVVACGISPITSCMAETLRFLRRRGKVHEQPYHSAPHHRQVEGQGIEEGAEGSRGSFLRANGEQDPKIYLGARCNAPPKVVNTTELGLGLGSATVRPSGLE